MLVQEISTVEKNEINELIEKKNALNKAYYGKAFSRFEYMGEVSVICHLPFGAISAYVNHYSSPRREWNVGMTIGWQLFNYRFVE